jgi:tRNA A-37 threonylcarbamoyl transferase component Bud32
MSQKHNIPYSIADRRFYEAPERIRDDETRLEATRRPAPEGWSRSAIGLYRRYKPDNLDLPEQGWKIHVSTTPDAAEEASRNLWDYCVRNSLAFKLLRSTGAVIQNNSKYWPRQASGKFCTIYPEPARLEEVVVALDGLLSHLPGPFILSDIRYRSGPVFVRYGAFLNLTLISDADERVPAIRDPQGRLVPDYRGPICRIPEFVEIPRFLRDFVDASSLLDDQPFTVDRPLHFSNGGGIYKGRLKDGDRVIALREARPNAGLDNRGNDSTHRLNNEAKILIALQGLGCVPEIYEQFRVWEHEFLATEFISGRTLLTEIIHRYPFAHPQPPDEAVHGYLNWVEDTFGRIEEAVGAINAKGVEIADLHPSNIMIGADGKVTIIDLECAYLRNEPEHHALGALGFSKTLSEPGTSGGDDQFALPRVLLMMLLPVVPILSLDGDKAEALVQAASQLFSLGRTLTNRLAALRKSTLAAAPPGAAEPLQVPGEASWPALKAALIEGMLSRALLDRSDILFRGDALQFAFGGASFAYGASGVVHAIHSAGGAVASEIIQRLFSMGLRGNGCTGAGFMDGLHGLAFTLDALGSEAMAREILAAAMAGPIPKSLGLFSGRTGVILNLLHLSSRWNDASLRDRALDLGCEISAAVRAGTAGLNRVPAGLMHGSSGVGLLLLRMYEATGDVAHLDAAEEALRQDVSRGESLPDGTFHLVTSPKYLIYLDGGSIGLALVLIRFLKLRENAEFRQVLAQVRHGCSIPFVMQPGLFQGRAGLIAALADFGEDEDREAGRQQAARLSWHMLRVREHFAFPGNGLTKLSDDLASGSAGVLLALDALFEKKPLAFPFLSGITDSPAHDSQGRGDIDILQRAFQRNDCERSGSQRVPNSFADLA